MGNYTKFSLPDWMGKKFSRLTVIGYAGATKGIHKLRCRCDCGNESEVSPWHLKNGHTRSCGCLQIEKAKKGSPYLRPGEAAINAFYCGYKCRAKKKKIEFSLSRKEFEEIILKDCLYCGEAPTREIKANTKYKVGFKSNGVDRINSQLGYSKDNSAPCCPFCNAAKNDKTREYFLAKIAQIYKKNFK